MSDGAIVRDVMQPVRTCRSDVAKLASLKSGIAAGAVPTRGTMAERILMSVEVYILTHAER